MEACTAGNAKYVCLLEGQTVARPAVQSSSDEKGLANEKAAIREQIGKLMPLAVKIDSLLEFKETVTDIKKIS